MEAIKQKETEALRVYHLYWESLTTGSLEAFSTTLDDSFQMIGTSASEFGCKKEDGIEIFMAQMNITRGKTEMRNRSITALPVGELFFINELCDIYILKETDWTFYSKVRISTFLHETSSGWKVVQQHGLLPDMPLQEDENHAINKISRENLEMRDAVKRYTADLENKNRELEIEAALERIRARAMIMHHTGEFSDVLVVLFQQYDLLGIKPMSALLNLFDLENRTFTHFTTGKSGTRIVGRQTVKFSESELFEQALYAWEEDSSLSFSEVYFPHDSLDKLFDLFPEIRNTLSAEDHIQPEDFPNGMFQTTTNCRFGNIGFMHNRKATDEEKEVVLKFAREFERFYQRFLDLKKAEAQAREAQIEASLERVRSRSLAMHHTAELQSVIHEVHQELLKLGLVINGGSFIVINSQIDQELRFWGAGGTADTSDEVHIPRFDKPFCTNIINRIKGGPGFFTEEYSQQEKKEFFEFLFKHEPWSKLEAKKKKETISTGGYTRSCYVLTHTSIFIINHLGEKFSAAENDILKRFGKVFEQSYTRFLDLQQAEAQVREVQVNLAVERVRAQALAMFKSEEILKVVYKLKEEFMGLDIPNVSAATIHLKEKNGMFRIWDLTSLEINENGLHQPMDVSFYLKDTHPDFFMRKIWENTSDYFVVIQEKSDFKHALQWLQDNGMVEQAKQAKEFFKTSQIDKIYLPTVPLINGRMSIDLLDTPTEEVASILKKMAGAFDLAYKRFEDLQKAEAQTREAQIEASLERVRAKAMAMHSSKDIESATVVVFNELSRLGIDMERCGITLLNETPIGEIWSTPLSKDDKEVTDIITGYLDFRMHPILQQSYQVWKEKKDFSAYKLAGDEVGKYYDKLEKQPEYKFPKVASYPDQQILQTFYFKEGGIFAFTVDELSAEAKGIIQKFTKVFAQTYTRFLDIQKAEEQAREAKIEASLERVRSRSMAMHKSEELHTVVNMLYGEFQSLEVNIDVVGIQLLPDQSKDIHMWLSTAEGLYDHVIYWPFTDIPVFHEVYKARKTGEMLDFTMSETVTRQFFEEYFKLNAAPKERKSTTQHVKVINITGAYEKLTGIYVMRYREGHFSPYEKEIIRRFSKAFEQTYTRFLDLQKAEALAREAQIEASLERVRSRSMAMQSSDEMSEVVRVMYDEVEKLEISNWGCALMIFDNKNKNIQLWFSEIVNNQHVRPYDFDNLNHELVRKWWKFWESEDQFMSIHLKDEENDQWRNYLLENTGMKDLPKEVKEVIRSENEVYFEYANMKHGLVSFINLDPFSEDIFPILKRFARTFEQAYTRFLDVQIAEESARRARQQASLDRVRADISAMRSVEDLNRVTPLIWSELTTLGIPLIRCGIFIIHEKEEQLEVYLSKPDGTSLAVMHLPFGSSDLAIQTVEAWREENVFTQHWTREEFLNWGRYMMEQGQIPDLDTYQGAEEAPESLHLHFVPFNQGMLYIGSTNPLSDDEIELSESLAKAFSIAYARYEDFVKLEKAKTGIEKALTELKATQSQLVQQEKLASLGQLTAAIAHEIKNPLNFVNNFSEMSIEMIDEIREELTRVRAYRDAPLRDNGFDGISHLIDDIESNLRKIHEHGSRADGIVKSMLQHSRGGSGKMEPTHLNSLIKEYVNLSFHGMRAGKNPISVKIEMDLDDSVGEIPLVAEDFSRVILNICNNGLDAIREKLKFNGQATNFSDYKPKLIVRSSSENGKVTVEIEDNGPGIPDEIKDKILQPFFTTKKGTQGTGLGLSITNDIVKAHGGNLDIQTDQDGSIFSVTLNI